MNLRVVSCGCCCRIRWCRLAYLSQKAASAVQKRGGWCHISLLREWLTNRSSAERHMLGPCPSASSYCEPDVRLVGSQEDVSMEPVTVTVRPTLIKAPLESEIANGGTGHLLSCFISMYIRIASSCLSCRGYFYYWNFLFEKWENDHWLQVQYIFNSKYFHYYMKLQLYYYYHHLVYYANVQRFTGSTYVLCSFQNAISISHDPKPCILFGSNKSW